MSPSVEAANAVFDLCEISASGMSIIHLALNSSGTHKERCHASCLLVEAKK